MKDLPLVLLLCLLITSVYGQPIAIDGDVAKPGTMTMPIFETLPSVEIKTEEHTYKGTYLAAVIQSAGTETGKKNVGRYVLITAADNYKVIFSFAEIDPDFTEQSIIVATHVDGKPLPQGEGPFRIIVPNDKKQARWIREVKSITVVTVK